MCSKQRQCSLSHVLLLPACVCMCTQTLNGGGKKNQRHVSMFEKISFPHMPGPQPASCSLKKKKKEGFFCSVPTLTSLRIFKPGHGLPVTCTGRAVRWDFSSISRQRWFIWDNTNSRPSQDEIRRCLADRHAHLPQSTGDFFFSSSSYSYDFETITFDTAACKQ